MKLYNAFINAMLLIVSSIAYAGDQNPIAEAKRICSLIDKTCVNLFCNSQTPAQLRVLIAFRTNVDPQVAEVSESLSNLVGQLEKAKSEVAGYLKQLPELERKQQELRELIDQVEKNLGFKEWAEEIIIDPLRPQDRRGQRRVTRLKAWQNELAQIDQKIQQIDALVKSNSGAQNDGVIKNYRNQLKKLNTSRVRLENSVSELEIMGEVFEKGFFKLEENLVIQLLREGLPDKDSVISRAIHGSEDFMILVKSKSNTGSSVVLRYPFGGNTLEIWKQKIVPGTKSYTDSVKRDNIQSDKDIFDLMVNAFGQYKIENDGSNNRIYSLQGKVFHDILVTLWGATSQRDGLEVFIQKQTLD